MKRLSVNLVVYNGANYISHLFSSLRAQTYNDWELNILDNGSTDDSLAIIEKELINNNLTANVSHNRENNGFAGGHNQLFKANESEFFLILNQDMYLTADVFEKMINFLDEDKSRSAVAPRLMKWNFQNLSDDFDKSLSDKIDTLGMKISRRRQSGELYAGEVWPIEKLAKKKFMEVFGLSGALLAMRRESADKIKFCDGSLFDESYHSYKEDVDMAFRMRSAGFSSYILFDAVVYHDRSAAPGKGESDAAAAANKKTQSFFVKYRSYKNQLATLYKNEYWQNYILDFCPILWYEAKKFVYYLLTQPSVLASWRELWGERQTLRAKRKEIISKRTLSWRQIREWWK